MDKVIAFVKSWQFMMGFFVVLCVTSSVLIWYGLAYDNEPGLMDTAPRWDRDKFPLRACTDPEAAQEDRDLAAHAIATTNDRLGFEAMRLLPASYREHDRSCLIILALDESPDYGCPNEGGSTSFGYDAEGSNEWPIDDGPDAGDDGQFLRDMTGTHDVVVQLCNVAIADERSLALQHELGHVLGLAHDPGNRVSIMQPVLHATPDGQLPPHITDHDRALLRELYAPRGQ